MTVESMPLRPARVLPAAVLSVLAAVVVATLAPGRAEACDKAVLNDRFTIYDRATTVAIVRAEGKPGRRSKVLERGKVALRVETVLKGPAATRLEVTLSGSTCDGGFTPGRRVVVFVDDAGRLVEGYEGVAEADKAWLANLTAWAGAASAADRAGLLVGWIAAGGRVGEHAATALAEHADALAALTPAQVTDLVGRLATVPGYSQLPLALARVHAPGLADAIRKRDRGPDSERTLTWGPLALPHAAETAFEAVTDPATLADAIATAPAARAAAALDRCERVRGRSFALYFQLYVGGGGMAADAWQRAATACRTGNAVTW